MKIKRQKHAKKNMGFYKHNFGFREPFQVLLDGTFCQAALRNKIQIREQLPGYLAGATQLCTTRCVLKELESLGKELYGAKLIAQRFQARSCSHIKEPVSGSACLLSMVEGDNPHHYFIATQLAADILALNGEVTGDDIVTSYFRWYRKPSRCQKCSLRHLCDTLRSYTSSYTSADQELATKVKKRAGVPLLFIIQNTMVLDKPSGRSIAVAQAMQTKQLIPEHQKLSIAHLKEEHSLVKTSESKKRKRKKAGGPNPLSCLKKKKKTQKTPQPSATKKRGNRKRKKRKLEATAGTAQSVPQNVET